MASSIQSKFSGYVRKRENVTHIQERNWSIERYRNEQGDGIIRKGSQTALRGDKIY